MHIETFYQVGGIVVGILALLGVVGGVLRWFYKRGGTEREYKIALDANTESNDRLTGAVNKVVDTLNDHTVQLATQKEQIVFLDRRVTSLEAPTHVSVSVDRNPSPA